MDNRILKESGYEERIRSKLGVSEPYLPNEDINQPECIIVAETNIIKQIPNYESLTGDDRVYLEAAVVCECCVLLCPSLSARLPKKETGPHEAHELSIDWSKKKVEFESERDEYIGKILDNTFPSIPHFIVTRPVRW
jgi:hypothetical protein